MSRAFASFSNGNVSAEALQHGPELWGGKGFGLMQMCADKLPVPPGFVISTEVCTKLYQKNPGVAMNAIAQELPNWLALLKEHFGYVPLLSVRSGARVSMPGMLDTVLNVGLHTGNIVEWTERIGHDCFVNTNARLHEMFKKVVGKDLPQSREEQVLACIAAVFDSWNSERAIEYRKLHDIPNDWGTAVVVQAMVFGNMGPTSGTGVAFTRDPSTGAAGVVGEYLPNAQGEDIVAGIKKPGPLTDIRKHVSIPKYNALVKLLKDLDTKYRDMQDVEFTIQNGEIFLLQVRSGKRSAAAAFRIANDLLDEQLITVEEARKRVSFPQFVTAQRPALHIAATEKALGKPITQGIAGSVGVAVGRAVFCALDQTKFANEPMVLIRHETTPDDIKLMSKSIGILTATGGFTSHAAVVARGMNIPCVTGCSTMVVQANKGAMLTSKAKGPFNIAPGDWVTIDGLSGQVWLGKGITSQDTDGAAIKFVQRLADVVGLRLRTSVPASRAYCTAAGVSNLVQWAMAARHVEEAVLDLRGVSAWVKGGEDEKFLNMTGQEDVPALAVAIGVLCEVKAGKNVQVILPDDATKPMYAALDKAGYQPVLAVNTLDDAFQGNGALRFGPKLSALAGGAKGAAFLREALEAQGKKFADEDTGMSVIDAARKLLAA